MAAISGSTRLGSDTPLSVHRVATAFLLSPLHRLYHQYLESGGLC